MKLKALVTRELESDLAITKAIYTGIGGTDIDLYHNHDMLEYREQTYSFNKGKVCEEQITTFLEGIQPTEHKQVGACMLIDGITQQSGRYDYFTKAVFTKRWRVPIDEVTDHMIQISVKARLTKRLMPKGYDEFTFAFDCKLLEQFKEGNLTMEQVIDGSKGECSI